MDQFAEGSLSPNASQHSTYFVIDTVSGIPLEVVARFQVNMFMEPIPELSMFKHLKRPLFMPAFWFETKMELADDMKIKVWLLSNLEGVMVAMGLGVALLAVAIVVILAVVRCTSRKRQQPIMDQLTPPPTPDADEVSDSSLRPLIDEEQPGNSTLAKS